MVVYILGAPGSGKSTVRNALAERLPHLVVADWDDFMEPAGKLAGVDIRSTREAWPSYRDLIRTVVDVVGSRLVLLGVCTPSELPGWPIEGWLLLDCDDPERTKRLASRRDEIDDAVADAADYRRLGLETIDSTGLSPTAVAKLLAAEVERRIGASAPPH